MLGFCLLTEEKSQLTKKSPSTTMKEALPGTIGEDQT
jgi:hypothetical protein